MKLNLSSSAAFKCKCSAELTHAKMSCWGTGAPWSIARIQKKNLPNEAFCIPQNNPRERLTSSNREIKVPLSKPVKPSRWVMRLRVSPSKPEDCSSSSGACLLYEAASHIKNLFLNDPHRDFSRISWFQRDFQCRSSIRTLRHLFMPTQIDYWRVVILTGHILSHASALLVGIFVRWITVHFALHFVAVCGFVLYKIGRKNIRFKAVQTELLESYSVQGWKAKPGIWQFKLEMQFPLNSWDLMNFKAVCSSGVNIQFVAFGCITAYHAYHISIEYPYPTLVKRSARCNTSWTALLVVSFRVWPLGLHGRRTAVHRFDNAFNFWLKTQTLRDSPLTILPPGLQKRTPKSLALSLVSTIWLF